MTDTATEIMFSYLVLIGFLLVVVSLTGQSIFGSAFPANPFTATSLELTNTCSPDDTFCNATKVMSQITAALLIPAQIVTYLWAIFIFFMTSSTLWWLGFILFIPAGIVSIVLLVPIIIEIVKALIGILQAIAQALPF